MKASHRAALYSIVMVGSLCCTDVSWAQQQKGNPIPIETILSDEPAQTEIYMKGWFTALRDVLEIEKGDNKHVFPVSDDGDKLFASVIDGKVTLHGHYENLFAIEVASESSLLSREPFPPIPGFAPLYLNRPFLGPGTWVGDENPSIDVLGVVDAKNDNISITGVTETSFLYSGAPAIAAAGDLSIRLGLLQCGAQPVAIPIGADNGLTHISCVPEPIFGIALLLAIAFVVIKNRRDWH